MTNNFNAEIANAVKNSIGCQFVGMEYESEVKLTKAQRAMLDGAVVTKSVTGVFQINYSYENAVNNRGERETGSTINFVAQSLPWGAWVRGAVNKLIEHKGEIYLRFYGVKSEIPDVTFFINGIPATPQQTAFLKDLTKREPTRTQTDAGVTENQVIARAVKLDSITRITIGGKTYERIKLAA